MEQLAPDHARGWWLGPFCNAGQCNTAVTNNGASQTLPAPAKPPYTPAGVHRLATKLRRLEIRLPEHGCAAPSASVTGHTTSLTVPGQTHAAPPHPNTEPGEMPANRPQGRAKQRCPSVRPTFPVTRSHLRRAQRRAGTELTRLEA